MLTYGGDPITLGMIAEARRRTIPVVFALHNFAYTVSVRDSQEASEPKARVVDRILLSSR